MSAKAFRKKRAAEEQSRAEAAEAEVRRLRSEVDFYGDRGDFLVYRHEWDALHEKVRRLTEGLREIERYSQERLDDGHPGLLDMHLVNDKARALLSASPDGANTEGGEA